MSSYVGPAPENTCPPGQGQTFTEELGRHCVDLFQDAPLLLAVTGQGVDLTPYAIAAGALVLVGLLLLLFRRKDRQ